MLIVDPMAGRPAEHRVGLPVELPVEAQANSLTTAAVPAYLFDLHFLDMFLGCLVDYLIVAGCDEQGQQISYKDHTSKLSLKNICKFVWIQTYPELKLAAGAKDGN